MIFLSPFLDVTRMSVPTVSFLADLDIQTQGTTKYGCYVPQNTDLNCDLCKST